MHWKPIYLTTFLCCVIIHMGETAKGNADIDVLSYHVQLEPDIQKKDVEGNVTIEFLTKAGVLEVVFDCGNLTIDDVKGQSIKSFRQEGKKLNIALSDTSKIQYEVQIFYHGSPSRGVVFFPALHQMHTVYFTSEWMVCHDQPDDRATIRMDLTVPDSLTSIGCGMLIEKKAVKAGKMMYSWRQQAATPPYTYGFAIGSFNKASNNRDGTALDYYSDSYTVDQLKTIFEPTADMLTFFEEKSGIPYFQTSYSQILIGDHYQEMSGFAVLNQSYGNMVLKDRTETNLIAHELAHQWWGNMITCENWGHIWLNEALATYMSAAFNEHRFGRDKYRQNIEAYHDVYKKTKHKGADKPLVFKDWSNPTADDRNLVYFKGAYVLHLLREELGDEDFWKGIRYYSQAYYGKSVITKDFQEAMEKSANRSLTGFFNEWVY